MRFLEISEFNAINSILNGIQGDIKLETILECYSCKQSSTDKELYNSLEKELRLPSSSPLLSSSPLSPPPSPPSTNSGKLTSPFGKFNISPNNSRGISNTNTATVVPICIANNSSFALKPNSYQSSSPNCSQDQPFGDLSDRNNRKTLIYLIATLSSVFRDYNFSKVRGKHFKKIESYNNAVLAIDTEFMGSVRDYSEIRNKVWSEINKVIDIPKCLIYSYLPDTEDDPLGETCLWNFNYFFYNPKEKKSSFLL